MEVIPNYTLLKKIGDGTQFSIYKGHYKNMPHRLLAIKALKTEFLSENQRKYFRQKIEHLKVLKDPRLLVPLSFQDQWAPQVITREYFEGIPLNEWVEARDKIDFDDFLTIACVLAELLENIHDSGIIHGGVKPRNILINPESLELRLIDFVTPTDVRNVSHFIYDLEFVKGTLAYTSPEQTGRISHRVEFTTDFYSLGIIFYELLTRKLPFFSTDPLELIHSHLAEEAPLMSSQRLDVPPMMEKIIEKLLMKEPEKRYQSGKGLLLDLLRLRHKSTHSIKGGANFPLGLDDRTHRITFISKMVGRDSESEKILSEYHLATEGSFRSLFISGLSGIGKTRLIQELQRPIVRNKGYFTSGKFDVYQKNIPYSSIIQAFRNLIRTFLTESDERVEKWKSKILSGIGSNGKVLIDVLPELQVLIGPQPNVQSLPPVEARNRFLDVFGRFLGVLANSESPLVLFIDDLQWCDLASFELLTYIFMNFKDHPYLFLLGAYRHNEVDSSHPLVKMIVKIREQNRPLDEIRLGPILELHTHEMVSYILDSTLDQTKYLAQFISGLAEGNPLFISESLSYLYNENLLSFKEDSNQFIWNMDKIRSSNMPSTVVALFSSKVNKQPEPTIELLEYCACMGNLFTPDDLAQVRGISILEVFELLKTALGQGLLIENKDQLQFVHDKVQEAALSHIDRKRRIKIHWEIGLYFFSLIEKEEYWEQFENIFTITSHLNIAVKLMKEEGTFLDLSMTLKLSHLNFCAGQSALNSLATDAANDYFKNSLDLLPKNAWNLQYERTFRVYQKLAKTELMVGHYENSERLLNQLLESAQSDLDKAEALAEQTTSLSSIGNFNQAILTAKRGLAFLGKNIPDESDLAEERCRLLMNEIHKENENVWNRLLHMPFTDERKSKIELSFYSELIPDLYMSGLVSQLYLSAAQSTQHCLAGGMDESVIYSFSIMGLNLGEQESFEAAFRYQDLAMELSEKYPNTFGSTRGMNGVVWCNMHSRSHPEEIVKYCLKGIQSGKNCGDLYNAGLCYGPLMWNLQVQGTPLSQLREIQKECLEFSKKFYLSFSVGLSESVFFGWIKPMEGNGTFDTITDKISQWEKDNHIASIGSYYMHVSLVNYYIGDVQKCDESLSMVEKYMHGLTDNVLKREWYVFKILNSFKLFEKGLRFDSIESLLKFVNPLISKIETWAQLGPLLKPYLYFVHAEKKRICEGRSAALDCYHRAITLCHEQNYYFLEGFLHQVLGFILMELNRKPLALMHFREALEIYDLTEMNCMKSLLHNSQPSMNFNLENGSHSLRVMKLNHEAVKTTDLNSMNSEKMGLPSLDFEYLLKFSNTIMGEMNTDILLKKIMNIVIELSGAQYGCLVMDFEGDLWVAAHSQVKEKWGVLTERISLAEAPLVCKSIVRYVHRTRETILLKNACEEGAFRNHEEVQALKLKSVFCLPFSKQNKLIGIIYLENRLSNSIFSPEQIELVTLMSSQAAISIENARLVDELRTVEKQITKALQEKDVLLREVHHRVKNNLQVISSLFNLQSKYIKDAEAVKALRESQNRVKSMAFVHEKLHQSQDLSHIDVAGYLKLLANNLARSYSADTKKNNVEVAIFCKEVFLSVDIAIPIGLIINEIVSNCFKHAFPIGYNGLVEISLSRNENELELNVKDNGVGFPMDIDYRETPTLGFQLITSLLEQIHGRMELFRNQGTRFQFHIPLIITSMAARLDHA